MATTITINVRNNSAQLQNFFFFQQPAAYTGGGQVYANSLHSEGLLPYAVSGAMLSFSILAQNYAGVEQQVTPPVVGQPSGRLGAAQPIGLTPAQGGKPTNNTTTMIVSPSLGLTVPVSTTGPRPGSFRIVTPVFDPTRSKYNAGSVVQTLNRGLVLSNFVTAMPNSNLDCQPILKFYVQTGTYPTGTVINFAASSAHAALCDATPDNSAFNVSYNPDGSWTVTPLALTHAAGGKFALVARDAVHTGTATAVHAATSTAANAAIKNEAGTDVIATGHAANFNPPVVVQNLSTPNLINTYMDYQVGPTAGPFVTRVCIQKSASTAVFS